MKVTLLFCVLAVYGAIAADDAADTTTSDSDSEISIGGVLELANDLAQAGIAAKGNAVAQGVGVVNTTVTSVTGFGSEAIENGTALAQSAIDLGGNIALGGLNVAEKITNQTMDFIDSIPVVGKFVPTNIMKNVFGKGISLGGKAVNAGTSAGKAGAGFGGKIGKNVMGGIGAGAVKVNDKIVAVDAGVNAVASNAATAAMNGISSGIKGFGNGIASFGNKLTTSATIPASSSDTATSE